MSIMWNDNDILEFAAACVVISEKEKKLMKWLKKKKNDKNSLTIVQE